MAQPVTSHPLARASSARSFENPPDALFISTVLFDVMYEYSFASPISIGRELENGHTLAHMPHSTHRSRSIVARRKPFSSSPRLRALPGHIATQAPHPQQVIVGGKDANLFPLLWSAIAPIDSDRNALEACLAFSIFSSTSDQSIEKAVRAHCDLASCKTLSPSPAIARMLLIREFWFVLLESEKRLYI